MSGGVLVCVSFVIIFNVIEAQVSSIFITPPPDATSQDNTEIVLAPQPVTSQESVFLNIQLPPKNNYQNDNSKTSYDYNNDYYSNSDVTKSDENNNNNSDQQTSQNQEYYNDYYYYDDGSGGREQKAVALEPGRYEYYQYYQEKDYDSYNSYSRGSMFSSDVYGQYQQQTKYEYQSSQDQMYSNWHASYAGAPSSPGFDSQQFLDAHNKHRREHCVSDLTWNENLAQSALKWADTCIFEHSDYGPGENLMYVPYSFINPEELVDQWVDEKQWYDYNVPYFHESYGHFLQAVWKDTTQLGCASSSCGGYQLVVCHYYPRGNVQGLYAKNVLPPCAQ